MGKPDAITAPAVWSDGKVVLTQEQAYRAATKRAGWGDGEELEVRVRRRRRKRSIGQNRRYWALLSCGAESLGWDDVEGLHEEVAYALLKLPDCPNTGLRRRMRTPKLETDEFSRYMDAVERFLIEKGADLTTWMEYLDWHERAA